MAAAQPPVLPHLGEKHEVPLEHENDHVELKAPAPEDDPTRFGADPVLAEAYARIMTWDEETRRKEEARLVRQLDLRIALPVVIMYVLNYLDRNSIAQARLSGLVKATGISENDYSLVNGIFYISYILAQIPANLLLTRCRPSWYMATIMVLWAIVSSCTAVCKNLGQLIAVRFILGFTEAPFFPGASYYLTCWYTRRELGKRYAIFISGICISNALAGLISAGIIGGMDGKAGIAGWQWLFIIEGSITVAFAVIFVLTLPDYPATTTSLSPEFRVLCQLRLEEDIGVSDNKDVGVMEGFRMAIRDYRSWVIGVIQFCIVIMIGFNWFYPTIVQGLGYKKTTTILLLTVPPYVFSFLVAYGMAWSADRTQRRAFHWQICFLITGIALILLVSLAKYNQPGAKYFATFILGGGSFAAYTVAYPWVASIMPRPATKRATVIALGNSFANLGAFVTSYVFYAELGPHYQASWGIVLALTVVGSVLVAYMSRQTGKRNVELDEIEERYKAGQITDAELDEMEPDAFLAAKTGFRLVR